MVRRLPLQFISTLLLIVVHASPSQAEPCSLSSLSWMTGSWHNSADPHGAQERWVIARQGVLMGSSWEFPTGKSGYAEIMTIKQQGETIAMLLRHFDGGLNRAWEERAGAYLILVSL
jgi:hypothetical protein